MNTNEQKPDCQIKDINFIANGTQEKVPFGRSVRQLIRKIIGPRNVRVIKKSVYDILDSLAKLTGQGGAPPAAPSHIAALNLRTGDLVRVRSKDAIEKTLNHFGQVRGCSFLPEMVQYCDTTQKVLKPVERFVDERDLRTRRAKGIVLLENVICQGTAALGRCDRNCFFFWREEWLEKAED